MMAHYIKENWIEKKLGDVLIKTETIDPSKAPNVPFTYIDVSSVNKATKQIENTSVLLGKDAPSRARKLVRTNDLIFATVRPTHGRVALINEEFDGQVCSTGYFVLRGKNFILNNYLFYFLLENEFNMQMEKLQKGANYPAVTDAEVKGIYVRFPNTISEQQRIVAILDEAFAAIAKAKANAERNLKNARELFESVKNELFRDLDGTNDKVPISEICAEIFAGGDAPKGNFSELKTEKYFVPIIANAVKDGGLYGYTDLTRVSEPSITIAARGSGTGHTEIRYRPFYPIVRLIVLTPDIKRISLEFLKYSIQNLDILSSGSAIPQLTIPMICEYSISLPTLSCQQIIVKKLDALSDEIKKLETIYKKKIADLDELKMSLLQKAFRGELTEKLVEAEIS